MLMLKSPHIFSSILILALASPAQSAPKNPDTFVHINAGDVRGLEPAWGSAGPESKFVVSNVYDPLIAYDRQSLRKYVPRVAEKVPTVENGLASGDGLTYRFPIRSGIRFHDGSQLTPEDVRYSLLRMMIMDAGIGDMLLAPLQPAQGGGPAADGCGERQRAVSPGALGQGRQAGRARALGRLLAGAGAS